jgi:WhiB family redox-sensing transcriptional regulator
MIAAPDLGGIPIVEARLKVAVTLDHLTGWLDLAECRHVDTNLFFPRPYENDAPAIAICGGCVARPDCLTYAMGHPELLGIWGGTTNRERSLIRHAA